MILRIDQTSPTPVYLQIRDQIVAAIARGELMPSDRLPSVRSLASDLGINLHTANKAYAMLRDEGHLLMRGRSGAVVADYQQVASVERKAASAKQLASELHRLALEHCAQGGTKETFLEEAQAQADRVFAGSGIARTQHDESTLGLDAAGDPLQAATPQAPGESACTTGTANTAYASEAKAMTVSETEGA